MASREDILADNLKEALRQCHKQIVFATAAALFLLLLVIPEWRGAKGTPIKLPILGLETDRVFAEILAAVAFFISGYLAYLAISRARRIMHRLAWAPHIREAVLMYPSIPTIIESGMRRAAVLLPVFLFLVATVPFLFVAAAKKEPLILVIFILSSPYVLLVVRLWEPLSRVKYQLTEHSLQQLQEAGMAKDLVSSLEGIRDREYPNRDQFLSALEKISRKMQPKDIRVIAAYACEEFRTED